jgi:hypothetical protein
MPVRMISIDGARWEVRPSGRITQYDKDEFGLIFLRRDGGKREVRVTRYSPLGSRWREQSLSEMDEAELQRMFEMSQPSFTSPEAGYAP